MPLLEWNHNFNLGVGPFDSHHQHLVALLNSAYDNFVQDSSVEGLAATLDEFFDHAINHFSAEKQYIEETSYTEYAEHLEQCTTFSTQVAIMKKDIRAGWGNLPLEMLTFLRNWLTYNILIADANYVRSAIGRQYRNCA